MSFSDMGIGEFSSALASASAVPGGGGASALCGALAASLGCMVCALSADKPECAENAAQLNALAQESESLRLELLALVDRDASAFKALMAAYALPKDTPERARLIESRLADAAGAPMEILKACCELIALMERLAQTGSRRVISDAGTGAVLAWGSMYAAALNVRVNTKEMRDREKAKALNSRADALMQEYWQRADSTYESVFGSLG